MPKALTRYHPQTVQIKQNMVRILWSYTTVIFKPQGPTHSKDLVLAGKQNPQELYKA